MEVIRNAVAAATRDPRFPAIQETELDRLQIAVDILHPSEAVADEAQLDPRRFGVILQSGRKRAVLLPDLEGIVTVAAQLAAVRAKAGLEPDEPVELRRFEVTRYQ
jgi:AMMECR1 domain-containing protein